MIKLSKALENSGRGHRIGYFSAYYRGLECLLDMWPEIRKEVPDATLEVYYGWESWLAFQGEDDFYHRMEERFAELKDQGVTIHGRVNHIELAKAMKSIKVWAYPTEFAEIHCITALKAVEAGCIPVVTEVAALKETVRGGLKVYADDIYTNKVAQEQFVSHVVCALKDTKVLTRKVDNRYWQDVAKDWSLFIESKLAS